MKRIGFCVLMFIGIFYFSEGKPCPEKFRPHKTRCEIYYKCIELPTNMHVWVPKHCAQGLVFESNLHRCVLPGEDWECLLDGIQTPNSNNNNNLKFNKTLNKVKVENQSVEMNGMDIYVVGDDENGQRQKNASHSHPNDVDVIVTNSNLGDDIEYEASGAGESLIEMDGFLQAENQIKTKIRRPTTTTTTVKTDFMNMEQKETETSETTDLSTITTTPTNIDPKLTEHLQRLSQLIDGLKQTYQSTEQNHELRPDQLNAFLSHFNIKNKFDNIHLGSTEMNEDKYKSTTIMPPTTTTPTITSISAASSTNTTSSTNNNLRPETKVVLSSNHYPHQYGEEYSNSHIVVNRPEGSILFNLPPYGHDTRYNDVSSQSHDHTPKISEETLKTVLELSKQMIANQNVPKIIPNNGAGYYPPPILQPVFFQPPQPPVNSFSVYYNGVEYGQNMSSPSSSYNKQYHTNYRNRKPARPHSKPPTTIIHNVIPVHLTSTNSGEKETLVDSYGQRLNYYPATSEDHNNLPTPINHLHHHSHRYETNKYIASITTVRPIISSTTPPPPPSTIDAIQYASYPNQISITTSRPFEHHPSPATIAEFYTPSPHLSDNNVNSLFHPPNIYPTNSESNSLPRPMNRPDSLTTNIYLQSHTNAEHSNPTSLFPALNPNQVKIHPNSQPSKFESVEMLDDGDFSDYMTGYHKQEPTQQSLGAQHMTYNYDDAQSEMNSQLAMHSTHIGGGDGSGSGNSYKNPLYMPRPSASSIFNKDHKPNNLQLDMMGQTHSGSTSYGSSNVGNHNIGNGANTHNQLVNVGGNFISFDVFKNSILPLLSQTQSLSNFGNVEVITCSPGIRQANITDCTRYYVCSKKDGKVLSYSCPPYTAFNEQTRICDARTYSYCNSDGVLSSFAISDNKRTQLETIKALQEAKRRREQAIKTHTISSLLSQFDNSAAGVNTVVNSIEENLGDNDNNADRDMLSSYMQQAQLMASSSSSSTTTTMKPFNKKRKYYCKEGDKIADQTSMQNYFVCYKNAQGMMKGHKMTCSKGLMFCSKTSMCTLLSKCM